MHSRIFCIQQSKCVLFPAFTKKIYIYFLDLISRPWSVGSGIAQCEDNRTLAMKPYEEQLRRFTLSYVKRFSTQGVTQHDFILLLLDPIQALAQGLMFYESEAWGHLTNELGQRSEVTLKYLEWRKYRSNI